MKKRIVSEEAKIAAWQTIRSTLVTWDLGSVSLLLTGSTLVSSAFGIILINSKNLGDGLTVLLCLILFMSTVCLAYVIKRFNNAMRVGLKMIEKVEQEVFLEEESLKLTTNLINYRKKHYPKILQFNNFYNHWAAGLVIISGIILFWRVYVLLV